MSVFFDNPVQPVLAMSVDLDQWQRLTPISDPAARWRIYLHQLALRAVMAWFQEEFTQAVHPWPHAAPFEIWHVVDGLALSLGEKRIVVMLSEAMDAVELKVPQEWVDLPGLSADYYIAAYVDVDQQRLALWGYTTYHQLKSQGSYDVSEQVYYLKDIDLVQDFSAFWVAQQIEQPPASHPQELSDLPMVQAENLIRSLAYSHEPRLAFPFSQWGALFSQEHWRQQLYQQRQGGNTPVSIEDWLEQIFEQGWQTLESLLPESPTVRFRSAAGGTAVLTCGKKIFLNSAPDDLLLMFSVDIEANKRRNIRIQLYPSGDTILPSNVMLALEMSETGQLLKSVKAGEHDDYIQIPPFRCSAGQRLRVHIQLAESTCQEDFIS
ncbi:hypothetical protein N836_25050 [Leptolyngbya sp. Heron Island J]|uniref:DUF1822 family protein n=1 Tax=Leptolyngbya sp. Heron Island J TaxID=1385935 RepID=UPI0003B960F8|nr:DUF1822 family protein [Leptolyngbya sp. Heron Island J]ESA32586.1 hypothetical protein N836_25050 [Leptolyngbya sp. Heron Island J]